MWPHSAGLTEFHARAGAQTSCAEPGLIAVRILRLWKFVKALKGRSFILDDDVQTVVVQCFRQQSRVDDGIRRILNQRESCLNACVVIFFLIGDIPSPVSILERVSVVHASYIHIYLPYLKNAPLKQKN
jgi:hypothetical protein